jgi:hypothetical protein
VFCVFAVVHIVVAIGAFGMAFGLGEMGSDLSILFGIVAVIVAPFLLAAGLLSNILPDNAALYVSIFVSTLMWWNIFVLVAHVVRRRRDANNNDSMIGD